ncbi:hypothetical protein [uncultured Sulfitobacter sp.]|uniref:hypothetical protein n=1 Tax=uncultured Sulfitobacter sp. TaxID=191468 RepID=UPI00262F480E|nr:hypothetical protein [uncultured Sulfitobacter sp.]
MTDNNRTNPADNRDMKDKAKDAANKAAADAKARAGDVADTVASEAAGYAENAKGAAADEVKNVASALRTAAEEMRNGSPQERTFSQIADGMADASDAMRDKDLGEMVEAVSEFGKRNPMIFLGGAALLGFAATRFAKASGTGAQQSDAYGRNHTMDRPTPAEPSTVSRNYDAQPTVATTPGRTKV